VKECYVKICRIIFFNHQQTVNTAACIFYPPVFLLMNYFDKKNMKQLPLIIALLFSATLLFAQNKVNPIIKSYGTVFEIPTADHKPDPATDYKIIVELTENTPKADSLNIYLEAIATLINLHAAEGVPQKNIKLVVILRKGATYAVFGDELFKKYFKVENPNRQLIKELTDAGVEFYVCGQTMIKRNTKEEELMPGTKIASSGLTAISTYQLKGYTMIKF
jgi:intracellular sulfur oxidation DsrE/DsrF family protein